VLIRNMDDRHFSGRIPNALNFINNLENELGLGFGSSTAELCENAEKGPTYLFTCPKSWQQAPPLLSLLTLMLRVGMTYEGGDIWLHACDVADNVIKPYQFRDDTHLRQAWYCIQNLAKTKCKQFLPNQKDNWPSIIREWYIHEYSGIVALSNGDARKVCPGWYRNV